MTRFSPSILPDPFGQAILDYYNKNNAAAVIERDDGLIDTDSGLELYFSNYNDWHPIEKKAIKFANGRTIDIGCGAGRHSLYLQKKGFDVLGIDSSPLAIEVCKLRGLKNALVIPFEKINVLAPVKFQTIMMFGNNFGLFSNLRKAKRLLKTLHKITTDDAYIIASTLDPYRTESNEHHEYHKLNRKHGRMCGQARIRFRYKKMIGPWFDYLFVSVPELKMILEETGWMVKKIICQKGSSFYSMVLKKL